MNPIWKNFFIPKDLLIVIIKKLIIIILLSLGVVQIVQINFFFFSGLSFKEHKIYDPNGYLLHFFSFFLITNESFSIKENNRINIEIVVANYHITQKNFHTLSPFVLCPEMSNNTFIIDVIDDYFHKNFSYFSEFIKNILVELSKPKYKMTVITNLSSLPTVKSYEKKRMKRENDLK